MNNKITKKVSFWSLGVACVFVFFMCQAVSAAIVIQDDFEVGWGADWHTDFGWGYLQAVPEVPMVEISVRQQVLEVITESILVAD